ncbi:phosphoribosyl-dephospho-CoA transferase [Klebsiella pneumoniae]|uniref:Phosphoribosyl-dephospho-CoA transferase n=1 Tax=Klebsiella pneumoniae TaxID=573 RepID=A0A2X3CR76_KLEPN|nr:phosphoribosyl-dephospho-CoA transferase [Klebsiella pneumoniae]
MYPVATAVYLFDFRTVNHVSNAASHDLVWLNHASALEDIAEPWVAQHWRAALPVVVRRDVDDQARVPVGVRGMKREQRAAGWVQARNIVRSVTPEMLVDREVLLHSPFVSQPPVQGAIALTLHRWPWGWGVTGSTGYALATEIPVLHAASDLDLLIRAPQRWTRGAAGMADPGGPTPMPRGYPGRNAVRRLRP